MKRLILLPLAVLLLNGCAASIDTSSIPDATLDQVSRVEPPCWWTGMKTDLQLLVQGPSISEYDVRTAGSKDVSISHIHKADSPNYLFIDIKIGPGAEAGTFYLLFEKEGESFKKAYTISERRDGSAQRAGFDVSDLIYLIMPDRFANADISDDNAPGMQEQADYQAFFGRHGGDLQGVIDHLPYIEDLGATAVWLNPALVDNEPRSSYHGYACADYYNIDPRFGGNEKYLEFVQECHKRGLKVIMDIVTNHCGAAHWWMKDLPFEDWVHQWPQYTHSNCAFSAQNDPYCSEYDKANMEGGWFDRSMPDMNLDNPFVLQYFKQWGAWWIEWADLDGFRVDTYPYNEKYPMSEWCKSIRTEYPDFNIVGEVWSENVPQVAYWQSGNPNPDGFDSNLPSVMDFCLQSAMCRALNRDREYWEEGITQVYNVVANDFYLHDVDNLMIFSSNHDIERVADTFEGDARKVKMMMTLVGTLRGIPQIYSGDELLQRSRDRSQGHGGLRVEFPDNWEENPSSKDLHDFCRTLFQWRKNSTAVQHGRTVHFLGRDNTYAYFRVAEKEAVFVFINNNDRDVEVPWDRYGEISVNLPPQAVNVITGEPFVPENVTIPPKSSIIVEFK